MNVTLMAHTTLSQDGVNQIQDKYEMEDEFVTQASQLAEFAGRLCYRAWNKTNPATATNEGYIANIIDHKHFSVLEHGSVTFLFEGVSRSLTHELVRHRHFSFSQVSGRYVDQSDDNVFIPESVDELMSDDADFAQDISDAVDLARRVSQAIKERLKLKGATKKQAQQAARFILPTNLTTDIVVTGNHRSWREAIEKRYSHFADPEIRELFGEVLRQLKALEPAIYADMEYPRVFDEDRGVKH